MQALLKLSRSVAIFIGAAGFLFGQVFTGEFSLGGTLAGTGGVIAGVSGFLASRSFTKNLTLGACAIGLIGAGLHVYEYYSTQHVPGNYYAWFLTGPFAVALIVIAVHEARRAGLSAAADHGDDGDGA